MSFISKNWRIAVIVAAAVAAGSFVIEHFAGVNPVAAGINTVASPIKNGFSYVSDALLEARDFIWDMRAYKTDNEKLEQEVIELKKEARSISEYKEENERLKKLLELSESFADYSTVAAKVVSYSQNGLYREIEINKGTVNGIKTGCGVVTPEGIVGTVTEAGPGYAIVTTILDKSSVIGIKVARTQGMGLAEGDNELAETLQCKLSFLDRNTPVIVGDIIETSGSGGIYPLGYTVGTVVSITADSSGMLNYAVIDPAVKFDALREVLVITGTK